MVSRYGFVIRDMRNVAGRTSRLANGGLEAAIARLGRLVEVRLNDLAQAAVVHFEAAGCQQRDQLDLHRHPAPLDIV